MSPAFNIAPVVKLDGQDLPADWLGAMVEMRVERQYQVPSRVTLRFTDPGYELLSSSKLALGKTVAVSQYDGPKLATAEITAISAEQRAGEQPELVVTALDKSHRLGRASRVKTYQNMKYSDMVSQVAGTAGLTPKVDSTPATIEYLMQAESDLALLCELARRTGFDWWLEDNDLNFAKPKSTGECTLSLGKDLRSFSARVSSVMPKEVQVDGWDRTKQQDVSQKSSPTSVPKASSPLASKAEDASKAFGADPVFSAGLGAQSDGEAEHLAQAVYDRAVTAAVVAKGTADGNAAIKLGSSVKIEGAGPLSGTYPVTEVEHVYRPAIGFVTRFVSGDRRPTTLVDTLGGLAGAPGVAYAGPAHFRSGLTVGKVTNNKDDQNMGRVKVRFPGMSQSFETGWARLVTVGAGAKRGAVWLPEVDDEVLVGFEGGDARQPVVIGGLFGDKSTMPKIELKDGQVQSRAMTSRLGHVISFLDGSSDAQQAVEVVLSTGEHKIHLGKDKLTVAVPAGVPAEITAGQASLKFDKSGNITLEGVNITINAKEKVSVQCTEGSVEAKATLDLKANAKLGVSGAIIEVQSQGPAKIAGSPVMIN